METKEYIEQLDKSIQEVEDAILQFEIRKEEIAAAIYELIEEQEK